MKNKRDLITAAGFPAFLALMLLLTLLLPKKDFSETEKRYLSGFPKASAEAIASGKWGSDLETYLADHIPGRDFFVGLNAYADLLLGKQPAKDIRVAGSMLVEAPVCADDTAVQKNLAAISGFAEAVRQDVALTLVPSAGWAAGLNGWEDEAILDSIYVQADGSIRTLSVTDCFRGRPDLYYRTDHHWTSEGAFTAYTAMMEKLGREAVTDFTVETIPDCFRGSTYSRSALWLTKAEDLQLWHGSDALTVRNAEKDEDHAGVFYRERLNEADKYTVFLDGNHSLVRITNPEKTGSILVIRDSYSNCLGCFLAQSYGQVVLVDLRYFRTPVSELAAAEGFDDIAICYSIGNFLTDANIVRLR